ncbi:Ig-like domain-containing protein [Halomonas binhaiensis]|uniref:Ig-like domain-containing protein n=1 Tax=Halomonas binhaiensis TaxID=2562282 RepID=A0A5C1NKC5_9GAMM|nr:Ig-like domain-containing protein [Halomonas binhaiensis]QEM83230.1 Ig-like domain-containing protein [Halomonas binhaiensis]
MKMTIELISRAGSQHRVISSLDNTVTLQIVEPSVVRVHESADSVVSYARQGDDLLIHNDERVIQLSQFFQADAQGQTSDLVLGDTLQTATHVTFSQAQDQAAAASADEAVVLTPQLAALPEALAQTLANVGDETLGEGQADVQVSVLQAEAPVLLADEVPSLSIDAPLAGDDVISAAEYGQALEITGTSTGLQTDDVVLVVLNGKTYSTAVEADGSWKVVVLAEDMLAVPAGVASIAASVTSASGAVVQDSHSVFVITGGVQVTIDELAGDGLLNAAEAQQPLSVTGSVNNASAGDEVVVSVLDREYTGVVDAQGQWSVDVPADIWQRLTDGDISVTATVTNAGGNSGSATREMTLDTQIPSVAINTLSEDDIVNAVEHGQALEVSGTTTGLQGGEVISVELDGQTYTSTVSASGEWSVVVRAGDVAALSDGEHTLTATVESHAGNPASGEHTMVVNTVTPTVTINSPLAGDGVIDATELSQSLEVSGTSTGLDAGSIVNVSIGDHNYTTEVEADGSWFLGLSRLEVSTFDDGLKIVSVSATNPIGNTGEATDFVVVNSEQGANFVVIDPITGDDQINAAEAASELAITGTAAQAPAGAVVTVTIDGKQYTGYVAADGSWSVPVSADAWADLADGNVTVSAEVSSAGSSGSATRDVLLDTEAPTLSLNPLAGDDIINAAEQQQALGVSGTTTGLTGGEVVTVELNGKSYTTTVDADGNWELYIGAKDVMALADGEHTVAVSVSDATGNPANVERDVTVAAASQSTLTITTPLAGDGVINAAEQDQPLEIRGTSTGITAGEPVNITLNDKNYSATVEVDGSWTLIVPVEDVGALPDGIATIVASATDSAGNTVDTSHQVTVDTMPPVRVATITGITEDTGTAGDFITSDTRPVISGGTGGAAPNPDIRVEVSLDGGQTWQPASTPAADGYWEYAVEQDLVDGQYDVMARLIDAAGNWSQPDTVTMVVDTTAPTIVIGTLAEDDIINATEHKQALIVSGSTSGLVGGEQVQVTLNGKSYTAAVATNGTWSLNVPADDVSALKNMEYTVTASVNDAAGNAESTERVLTVDAQLTLVRGSENFEVEGSPSLQEGESYTYASGLTLTGIKGRAGDGLVYEEAPSPIQGTSIISRGYSNISGNPGEGGIGGASFGGLVDSFSFEYKYVNYDAFVEIYDANGNLITTEQLTGINEIGPSGPYIFSYDAPEGVYVDHIRFDFEDEAAGVVMDNFVWGSKVGTEDFEAGTSYISEGESYTYASGLTLTGVKNNVGKESGSVFEVAIDPIQGTSIIAKGYVTEAGSAGEGSIGDVSFGGLIDSFSFQYKYVNYDAFVEIYDANGNRIATEKLTGINEVGPSGPYNFTYEAPEGVHIDHIRFNIEDEMAGVVIDNFAWQYSPDVAAVQHEGIESLQGDDITALHNAALDTDDSTIAGTVNDDQLESTAANDHFTIGNGGNDTLTYRLLDATDATGGNGADHVGGFTVGKADSTSDADRIDLSELLADSGYQGAAGGEVDAKALADYLKVTVKGSDTEIAIDRDGAAGTTHEMTTLATLSGVQTDLATLLANHQLVVS